MRKGMLGKLLLSAVQGPRDELERHLSGENGDVWLRELKKFLQREPCWVPWEDIVHESMGSRVTLASEQDLQSFSFLAYSLYPEEHLNSKMYLAPPMSQAANYASKDYILVGFRLMIKPVDWKGLLHRLGGGGRTPIFTDFEELRAIIASLILKQPSGSPGVLSRYLTNRFLLNDGSTMNSVTVIWRDDYGWGIGFEDHYSYSLNDNYIVMV